MRNSIKKFGAVFAACILFFIFSCAGTVVFAQKKEVYIGGMPAGFTMGLGGAQIVGVCEILTEDGTACPAKQADLLLMPIRSVARRKNRTNITWLRERILTVRWR